MTHKNKHILNLLILIAFFSMFSVTTHAQELYIFTHTLQIGSRGTEVRALQEALKQVPDIYPEGFVTGYFGPLTRSAVMRLQIKAMNPAYVTGVFGPITRSILNKLMISAGTTGTTGNTGAPGATGQSGATGAIGQTGPIGADGATGTVGATGLAGAVGPTGLSGPVGPTGATGTTGATGQTGQTGAVGPTGADGAIGTTGVTGQSGATGAIGQTGSTGADGAIGTTGATGEPGATGQTGAAGTAGTAGEAGIIGTTGPNFLSVSTASADINKNRTFVIISGGSFIAAHAYCAMVTAPGVGKVDNFIISVAGTMIGTCIVSGTATFGSTTLTATNISPGTVVKIDTNSTGTNRVGSVAIGQ